MTQEELCELASFIRKMFTGTYENMKDLTLDSDEAFLEKLNDDDEKLRKVYDKWLVREYITNKWFYHDLEHKRYRELIFSSERGCALLQAVYRCTFPKYIQGSGSWPVGLIADTDTEIIDEEAPTYIIDVCIVVSYPETQLVNV